jgi:hypothetical protein
MGPAKISNCTCEKIALQQKIAAKKIKILFIMMLCQ